MNNLKDSTAILMAPSGDVENSIEIDKSFVSSQLRSMAIETEVKKIVDELHLTNSDQIFEAIAPSRKKIENDDLLNEVEKLNYGFRDSKNYSRKTQTWQGFVLEINKNRFVAKLEDISNPGGNYEIAEFDKTKDISPGDEHLLEPGAVFYWSVGSVISHGELKKESILRFKRVAQWTAQEYDEAVDLAASLYKDISWD